MKSRHEVVCGPRSSVLESARSVTHIDSFFACVGILARHEVVLRTLPARCAQAEAGQFWRLRQHDSAARNRGSGRYCSVHVPHQARDHHRGKLPRGPSAEASFPARGHREDLLRQACVFAQIPAVHTLSLRLCSSCSVHFFCQSHSRSLCSLTRSPVNSREATGAVSRRRVQSRQAAGREV